MGHLKIIYFPFVPNGKFIIFRCPKIWANYSLIIMCLNILTPNNHHFPFGTNGKVEVLGVPILTHFRVVENICRRYSFIWWWHSPCSFALVESAIQMYSQPLKRDQAKDLLLHVDPHYLQKNQSKRNSSKSKQKYHFKFHSIL